MTTPDLVALCRFQFKAAARVLSALAKRIGAQEFEFPIHDLERARRSLEHAISEAARKGRPDA